MAYLKLFGFFLAFFTAFPTSIARENKLHDLPILPSVSKTDSVCSNNRDTASLMVVRTFGLTPNMNSIIPPLLSCFIMSLLHKMVLLPSGVHTTVSKKQLHCSTSSALCRVLILILLMISGNVHVHPGPSSDVTSPNAGLASNDLCFDYFCARKNLGFLHVNTRSILPKMDQLKVWVESSNPDVLVITETWLRRSIPYPEVNLSGYKLFRQDRSSRGGGVAIFAKEHLQCTITMARSIPKQFDLLVLNIKLSNNFSVSGWLLPPSICTCLHLRSSK